MLNQNGFDLWADGYDKSVGLSEEAQAYPFAGYKNLLNEIYNRILSRSEKEVLDMDFRKRRRLIRLPDIKIY